MAYKTPGVYVEEISTLPASVAEVETAIPAFIGFTADAVDNGIPITEPRRIKSLVEFQKYYGGAQPVADLTVKLTAALAVDSVKKNANSYQYYMFDSLRVYFDNGGGDCYVVSIGKYGTAPAKALFKAGLKKLEKCDEPTLIVFPDAVALSSDDLHSLQVATLQQCNKMQDRFGVFDLKEDTSGADTGWEQGVTDFRDKIGINNLKYGAAYTPWIQAGFDRYIPNSALTIKKADDSLLDLSGLPGADSELVSQATVSLRAAQASSTKVKTLVDLIPAQDKSIQTTYRELAAALGSTPNKANFKAVLAFLLKMVTPFGIWTKPDVTANSKQLTGNMALEVAAATDNNVRDALKKLMDYHETAAGANPALADAIAAEYNDVKAANQVNQTVAPAVDAGLFGTANSTAGRVANALPKLNVLFNTLFEAVGDIQIAAATAEMTADKTLYEVFPAYKSVIDAVRGKLNWMPPSGAIVGIYAAVDRNRGVWKAPANVSLSNVNALSYAIDHDEQERLNVDVNAGKSVNAIRSFSGKGLLVWGARTLAGNDNEWRYVSVRRFYNMVEESIEKSTGWVVFEPNDSGTWIRVKAMISNYLTDLWRRGALAGAKPEQAFFVNVGLGTTMTAVDILEGRMIIEIGMAAVRPAEFIILRFSHKLQEA